MTDRITEIVNLQNEASIPAAQASTKKWAEAKLIWEEHDGGKSFPILSEDIKAAGGRGSSLGYLSRMERCWRFFVIDPGIVFQDFAELGDFQEAYRSETIQQGKPDREQRERKPQASKANGHGKDKQQDADFSAHGLVDKAEDSLSKLARNPAFWSLLTEEDRGRIQALCPLLDTIMAGIA